MEKIFQEVVKIVSEGTGINGNDLIHSKKHSEVFNIAKNKDMRINRFRYRGYN